MNFTEDLILENERVILRPLQMEDAASLIDITQDPDLWRFTPSKIGDKHDLKAYIERALDARKDAFRYPFAIFDKFSARLAGSTSYANFSARDQRIEVGYSWLGRDFQGTGINQSCKYLLFRHAFESMEIVRLELKTDVLNRQSRRAMVKVGAKEEGILRSHTAMHDGRRRDTIYYSILQEEWEGIKQRCFQELAYK